MTAQPRDPQGRFLPSATKPTTNAKAPTRQQGPLAFQFGLSSRSGLAGLAGETYGGLRDLFAVLGYKDNPGYSDFEAQWRHAGIAKRIIDAFPAATWSDPPEIRDDDNDETETAFEKAWVELEADLGIFHHLHMADRLASLGRWGVLHLGFSGSVTQRGQVKKPSRLLWLNRYSEADSEVREIESRTDDPRFGLPTLYNINIVNPSASTTTTSGESKSTIVHADRILHIAEDPLKHALEGTPRLEGVFNYSQDLIKIVGGAAEMFWLAAGKRLHLDIREGKTLTDAEIVDLRAALVSFQDDIQKTLRTEGIDVKELFGHTADPSAPAQATLQLISGTTGIPIRILIGSERGELSSAQDENNWNERIRERVVSFADKLVLRPFIQRLIDFGVLPKPKGGVFETKWPDLTAPSQTDRIKNALTLAQAANTHTPGGAELVVTREEIRETAGFDPQPDGGFDEPEPPLDEDDPEVQDQFGDGEGA